MPLQALEEKHLASAKHTAPTCVASVIRLRERVFKLATVGEPCNRPELLGELVGDFLKIGSHISISISRRYGLLTVHAIPGEDLVLLLGVVVDLVEEVCNWGIKCSCRFERTHRLASFSWFLGRGSFGLEIGVVRRHLGDGLQAHGQLLGRCHSSTCFEPKVVVRVSEVAVNRLFSLWLYFSCVSHRVFRICTAALHHVSVSRKHGLLTRSLLAVLRRRSGDNLP